MDTATTGHAKTPEPSPVAARAARRHRPRTPRRRRDRPPLLATAAVGLGMIVLAGCGTATAGHGATGGTAAAGRAKPTTGTGATVRSGATAMQTCGTTRTAVGVPVVVELARGSVSCATALHVQNAYAARIRAGDVAGTGGGAPVRVDGWTCQGYSTPAVLRTGQVSVCRNPHGEVLAVLPAPSGGASPEDESTSPAAGATSTYRVTQ